MAWVLAERTSGPSTTLRSDRDDNSVMPARTQARDTCPRDRIFIPAGAKRSGGRSVSSTAQKIQEPVTFVKVMSINLFRGSNSSEGFGCVFVFRFLRLFSA